MKTIVYYYSRQGSNRYLANKIAADLNGEIEEIKPRLNAHVLMLLGLNLGNRQLKNKVEAYDRVILCGPIWMGKLIVPLKNFVIAHRSKINQLIFVTCCGSTFDKKDETFGHALVFNKVKELVGKKCLHCEAFPIVLVLPDEQKNNTSAFMKTHLNHENFAGEIMPIYNAFISRIKELSNARTEK